MPKRNDKGNPTSEASLRSQIDRILREASSEGKVPPASVQKLVDSALAATNGKLTEETIAWLEEHVANLPVQSIFSRRGSRYLATSL
jgi:hypothetical protein